MGAQDYEFNFHNTVYNYDSLKALIEQAGFRDVARWTTVEEFGQRIGDWSQVDHSLNLKAIKPAARQASAASPHCADRSCPSAPR